MIGLDTNVLLRFLVPDDDRDQHAIVARFMAQRTASDPAFVSLVTLTETVWLLRRRLRYPNEHIRRAIVVLLSSPDFVFEEHDRLMALCDRGEWDRGDLADHLIAWIGLKHGCVSTVTFDRQAARAVPGMELLQ